MGISPSPQINSGDLFPIPQSLRGGNVPPFSVHVATYHVSLTLLPIAVFQCRQREGSDSYQFVIDPSGRKYVCARFVSYFDTSMICVSLLISNSTPSPGLSVG